MKHTNAPKTRGHKMWDAALAQVEQVRSPVKKRPKKSAEPSFHTPPNQILKPKNSPPEKKQRPMRACVFPKVN